MGSTSRTSGRGAETKKYALTSDEDEADFWGFAADAEGLFTPLEDDDGARRVRLMSCDPRGGLRKSLDRIGRRSSVAGNGWIGLLDADGETMGSYFVNEVTVVDVQPSSGDAGLNDVTLTLRCDQAYPERPRCGS